jgi:teichuronic acid biosynthesis glycosyltransferase TuaG
MSESIPCVSVIIPVHNGMQKLIESVQSVQTQTMTAWEIIIIDDGSTDQTIKIAKDLASEDARIHAISLSQNSNRPAVPRNAGIALARGKYLAFLDHDDLWFPRKLERHLSLHSKFPDLALTHSAMWHYPNRRRLATLLELPNPLLQKSSHASLMKRNLIYCSAVVVKREVVISIGGFDERPEVRAVEDYALWLKVAESNSFAFIPEVLGFYRTDGSGIYDNADAEQRLDLLRSEGLVAPKPARGPLARRLVTRALGLANSVWLYGAKGPIKQRAALPPNWI